MHIKRLEIQGFKTFADHTELELTSGITAVVGPNGSGKSNIADAIAWVLGEQNVRNLRGVKSCDVIFSGSERRKALGLAEVSLTIDNSCGSLPIDFSEVTVTRRVYRSGESEYLINKSACRLKDIYELFLDTGMGREAYSMVTQGEIDAILSAKSEDRRTLFEEAAGIKKYRVRRREAERKLDNTEGNLRRVNDIVSELSSQVEPLAEQAEIAERYDELSTRLREIESGLLINDLRRWTAELERVRQLKAESSEQMAGQDKRISDLEWEKEKQGTELAALDHKVEMAHSKQQEASAAAQRVRSRLALAEERQRAAEEARQRLEAQIEQLEHRIEEASARLERLEAEHSGCVERETRLAEDVSGRSAGLESIASEIESAQRIVDDRKSAYVELARDQAAKRAELEALRSREAELTAAVAKYAAELQALEESRTETGRKCEEFAGRQVEIHARDKARQQELPPLVRQRDELKSKISTANEELAEINRSTVGKASRLATLNEMAEAHEGFFEGVRSVMDARKARKIQGHYAVVADVITVPKGFETAIEVALGSAVQDIITDTVDEAKEAIQFLKENRAGRATFLPLNGLRPQISNLSGGMKQAGVLGFASDILSYDKRYSEAMNVLLGRVVVVDTIDNAVRFSRASSGWGRIVTLDGEVIVPTGAMSGGVKHGKGPNLLGRKQEIDSLTVELSKLDAARVSSEKVLSEASDGLGKAAARIDQLEQAAGQDKVAMVEVERQLEFLVREQKRIDGQIEVVASEKEEAEGALSQDSEALKTLEAGLSAAGQENLDLDELVAGAQTRLEELNARRETISEELMEMSVTLASVRERRAGLGQTIQQTKTAIVETEAESKARRAETEHQMADALTNAEERQSLSSDTGTTDADLVHAQQELDTLSAERAELGKVAAATDLELKSLNHGRAEAVELLRDCDVKEARLEIQVTQTSERLLEEYDITSEEALAREEMVEVERGTATEVARLRKEIKAMGPVNTGAVQEYARISERWEFLVTQKTDLEDARAKLQDAIREIDEGTRELFMGTFRSVADYFDRMFRRLFGGGRTELVLTDPSNLLDTGVEIIVQPPGKKLQNLQLLSGGERALTASALLFALLMAKPSPFVLFDEVDAPLDDSNVERFAEVLHEFAMDTQFIIITHNRATMEAADTLYGVTMQEPGISKMISVSLADKDHEDKIGRDFAMAEPVGA